MAKVEDITSNKVSGRVGELVYANLNGQTIVRRRPKTNPDKRTPAQLRNQERFRLIHQFCAQFKRVLIPRVWNDYGKADNGYNLFVKTNAPAFGPDGELANPGKLSLSVGELAAPEQMEAHREGEGPGTVRLVWQKNPSWGGLSLKDELMVISAGEGSYSDIKATGLKRSDLGGSFELPAQPANVTHIYLFFASQDKRKYSPSVCLEV